MVHQVLCKWLLEKIPNGTFANVRTWIASPNMRRSQYWNASEASWRYGPALRRGTRGDPSRQSLHYPIRQWPPALTVSLRPSSSNTFGGYAHQEARHHALCLAGLAATIRTTSRSISICQWRESLAWEGESAHLTASLPALAGGRSPDRTRDQRSPHPTWDSAPSDDLWTEAVERSVGLGTTETLDQEIRRVSDAKLWQFRAAASKSLVEYARERLSRQLAASAHLLRRSKPPSISASLVDRPSCTCQESLRRQGTKHACCAQPHLDLSRTVRAPE